MKKPAFSSIASLALALVMVSCAPTVQHGSNSPVPIVGERVFLIPFDNATDHDFAGKAITELAGTALIQRGVQVVESIPAGDGEENPPRNKHEYLAYAQKKGLAYAVTGVVQEYKYKTDLDGDPAVGATMKILSTRSGSTLWQGSGSNVGVGFSSLTSAAQHMVKRMVSTMPLSRKSSSKPAQR